MPNLARFWNKLNAHTWVVEIQNGTIILEKASLLLVFILVGKWKQFKCPTISKWIKIIVYRHALE